jgi:hypothetical protein
MQRVIHYPSTGTTVTLLFCGLLFSPGHVAASSYLQQLEAEAAATDSPTAKPTAHEPPANSANWSRQQTSLSEKLDPGLTIGQFEESLKQRFYGSYLFYSALNDTKQQAVYQEYQKDNDIEHLREVIKAQMTR